MASTGQDPADLLNAIARIKTLTNAQLKDILRNEGLPVSGVKISLQTRIITCSFLQIFNFFFFAIPFHNTNRDLANLDNIPLNRYGETLREGAP